MAVEWREHGLRANVVSPGSVATQRTLERRRTSETSSEEQVTRTPVDDVANAIMYLMSDLSAGITGQNIIVDCGLSANYCSDSFPKLKKLLLKEV
jgi:NAD(P)-dependent dehydrogenase (short-subunit alcohol dehydrogenase family)